MVGPLGGALARPCACKCPSWPTRVGRRVMPCVGHDRIAQRGSITQLLRLPPFSSKQARTIDRPSPSLGLVFQAKFGIVGLWPRFGRETAGADLRGGDLRSRATGLEVRGFSWRSAGWTSGNGPMSGPRVVRGVVSERFFPAGLWGNIVVGLADFCGNADSGALASQMSMCRLAGRAERPFGGEAPDDISSEPFGAIPGRLRIDFEGIP